MPRDGSGTYTLPSAPLVAGTPASAAPVQSNFADIATAITGSLPVDGSRSATAATALAATTTGMNVLRAADATAARAAISAMPQGTNSVGVGQKTNLKFGDNVAAVLPAGGTWEWDLVRLVTSSGGIDLSNCFSGVSAGGTTVGSAAVGFSYLLTCKRQS